MVEKRHAWTALLSAVATVSLTTACIAEGKQKFEISLETGPNHVRNIGILEWAEHLEKQSNGKLEVKVYHGAAKFKDTDIPKALNQGAVDMGLPGTWHLGKFVPDFDAADLPMFYGLSQDKVYKVWDGAAGRFVVGKIEEKLGVKVIGRWLDLGFQHTFSVGKPIKTHTDMQQLKIRIPGGAASVARYDVLGANPLKIAWPDVPQALQRGTIDGLATTFESTRSAKLWDSGVKHAYVNNQTFSQYLPVVSGHSWAKFSPEIQQLITKSWEDRIVALREKAAERQASARKDAEKSGIVVVDPAPEDLAETRKKLMVKQDDLVKELKIDPELVKLIKTTIGI